MSRDRYAALYVSYVLYFLISLQVRYTLSLLVMVLNEGRRQRSLILECANNETFALLHSIPSLATRAPRRCWMQVRSKDWWERVVLKEFTDEDWRETFRMTRRSFMKLCGLMEEVLRPQDVTVRAPIPLQMRVAIVLYKLVSCTEYNTIAKRFGVHKTTVKKFVYSFSKGMVSTVINDLIRLPTAEEARVIARGFEEKFGIPQVVGFIDRIHIPVLPPSDAYKHFVNRQGWPSYVLQAVVDHAHRFRNINCKMPGCTREADVLRQSSLFDQAHLLPKVPRVIGGNCVNFFMLGGPAYPLMDWLIRDHGRSAGLTPQQQLFNVRLRSARSTAETAFWRLKARWKVLLKKSLFHYTFTPYIVATCCALHNFCESEEEDVDPDWTEEAAVLERDLPQPEARSFEEAECPDGQRIRLALTEYLQVSERGALDSC